MTARPRPEPRPEPPALHPAEVVSLDDIRPHPRNYQVHPEDQLDHLVASIGEHGLYRNIVVARDGTILAGHGVVEAARRAGLDRVPVVRLDIDPDSPAALKVLTGDNEVRHLVEADDRMLSELLKEVADSDPLGLAGTGYDLAMLANLVFVSRPESEIRSHDEAASWVGMPEYESARAPVKLVLSFATPEDRAEAIARLGLDLAPTAKSSWFPAREKDDIASVRLVEREDDE